MVLPRAVVVVVATVVGVAEFLHHAAAFFEIDAWEAVLKLLDEFIEQLAQGGLFVGAEAVEKIGAVVALAVEFVGGFCTGVGELDDLAARILGGWLADDEAVLFKFGEEFGHGLSAGAEEIGQFFLADLRF